MADGGSYQIDIPVSAAGVDPAAAATDRLADRLLAAGEAASVAAQAVAAGEAAYAAAEAGADRAAKAVERIGLQADAQQGKLQAALDAGDAAGADRAAAKLENLLARQSEAVAKAASAADAMNEEAAALDRLKAAAADAASAEQDLSREAEAAASSAREAADSTEGIGAAGGGATFNMRALSGAFGKLGGPLGAFGQQSAGVVGAVQKMSGSLGAAGPYVAAAVLAVAATFAVVAGIGALVVSLTKFGIANADAARTSALLSDGIAGSVAGGRQLDAAIASVGAKVPMTSAELQTMAGELAKTGLRGEALSKALEDNAIKASKLKFGPDFAKQMLSLDFQSQKLKSNVSAIFGGLKIEGLLEGLQKLVALFDANSASGKAIKVVFESLFQPIIDGMTGLLPKAQAAFLQIEILLLKGAIAIKPYGSKIQLLAEGFGILAAIITGVVIAAVAAVAAPFVLAGAAISLVIAGVLYLISEWDNLGASAAGLGATIQASVGAALDWLGGRFDAAIAYLQSISLAEVGGAMIDGLVEGITSAGPKVLQAISGLAGSAVGAAKKALGIASPSKVFAEIGVHTAEGMASGVDDAAPGVKDSLESMVAAPAAAASGAAGAPGAPGASAGAAKGGGHTFQITITGSAADAEAIAAAVRKVVQDLLDGDMAQMGAAVPA